MERHPPLDIGRVDALTTRVTPPVRAFAAGSPYIPTMARASELYPLPLSVLLERFEREIAGGDEVYGVAKAQVWRPDPARDLTTLHFGQPLGTPLGPAAGPHTQLAQNLLAGWLGGARFFELKTVQVLDELELPRPCIHAPNVGYNVEWSQELHVPESAVEYAKAWLLVHHAAERLGIPALPLFDLSVGYDLAGIRGEKVTRFLDVMRDASALLDSLRGDVTIDTPTCISRTLTLSTFHGCPAGEIEGIATYLMRERGLDVVVKLNPTLLGEAALGELLHERLGYRHIALDSHSFEADLKWDQLMAMVPRLRHVAAEEGVGFGVKFSNTLVCRSPEPPFGAGDMYLSGPPLHPIAATLAARFIDATASEVPVTFSAGVDAQNFADVVAAGIAPVTTCTDLLKGKGYGRLKGYLDALEKRMAAAGVERLDDLPRTPAAQWAAAVVADPRYAHAANRAAPRKVGTRLVLLDCLTCDKCQPVCPNLAIQDMALPVGSFPAGLVRFGGGAWSVEPGEPLVVRKRHQITILADACNRCGQCDPTCPEEGGPFATKPNLFLDARAWEEHPGRDGFRFEGAALLWREAGVIQRWCPRADGGSTWNIPGGTLTLAADFTVLGAEGAGVADLRHARLLSMCHDTLRCVTGWRPPAPVPHGVPVA